ncbi:MAG: chromate efflux transporter [Gemmatimonadales bacterium]|nr:MAG: chromate efflux transporter [Gemmatimonadales bacterium]
MSESVARPGFSELAGVFLKLSLLGFGGPNAHLALMLEEVVERRRWLSREHFLELMAVTNLLPGPNSSEVAIHIGYSTRGWRGALVTGGIFLLPTFLMVTAVAALYFRFGTLPHVEPVFWALKPVVLAIILRAGFKLARTAVKDGLLAALAVAGAAVGYLYGGWVVPAMALGGLVTWARWRTGRDAGPGGGEDPGRGSGSKDGGQGFGGREGDGPTLRSWAFPSGALVAAVGTSGPVLTVFLLHLGIGAVLFGGGYVLVILLEPYAVGQFGWLTAAQFLDGVALTQVIPGPISTLSAFVGFAAAGLPGAVAGTAGVYLPAFAAVLLVAPHLERLREKAPVKAFLLGVSAVVGGGIVGVAGTLAVPSIPDLWGGILGAVALVLLLTGRVSPAVAILAALTIGGVRLFLLG